MKQTKGLFLKIIGLALMGLVVSAARMPTSPFVPMWDEGPIHAQPGQTVEREVRVSIPSGHYLYVDKSNVEFTSLDGLDVKHDTTSEIHRKPDPLTGREIEVYLDEWVTHVTITIPETANGPHTLVAELAYQGCSSTLCLRPESQTISWSVAVGVTADQVVRLPEGKKWQFSDILQPGAATQLIDAHKTLALVAAALGGVLTAFTPCVLPILPVIFLFMGIRPRAFRHNMAIAALFSFGMIMTYSILGIGAALAGAQLGFLFQSRFFLIAIAVFYLLMALSMWGLFTIQLPVKWRSKLTALGSRGPKGSIVIGMTVGLLAAPCVGPVMGGLLVYVSTSRDLIFGPLLVMAFGAGMGFIFVWLGTFYGQMTAKLTQGWFLTTIKIVLGLLLLLPAYHYGRIAFLHSHGESHIESTTTKSADGYWVTDFESALKMATITNRPMMVDFFAEWCPPCREMDEITFQNEAVLAEFATIVPVRIDATFRSEKLDAILERYNVVGWPTILFLSPKGEMYNDLSQVGLVIPADEMVELIRKAVEKAR